ncbi:MAG: aminopeptidase P family N-terminal domain-containing protein [Actinomycetota bacterium]|nr:aminopeptidase P family N-terminal domain-containing protein [Actinomycetota bacterium]
MATAQLREIELPDFGMPETRPTISHTTYRERLSHLRERMKGRRYDFVVVYGDREHSANLAYLTGFDPRFEEAIMIVGREKPPLLLAGNECVGLAEAAPLPMRVELHQDLSLPGQPRDRSRPLSDILTDERVESGSRVGTIGWKEFSHRRRIEIPAFIVDDVRSAVGAGGVVENATDTLTGPADGLRVINEVEQLAAFEYAACHTSNGVRNLLFGLRPGMREDQAVRLLEWNGDPLSCHLMLSSGARASLGLLSPSDRHIERGDQFTTAFGIWGALNCRAGFVVADPTELPLDIQDYVERLVAPYFEAIAEWYEALHVGQTGGVLQEIIDRHLGDPFFGIFLNPGHQLHLDEWVNSPVAPGSTIELRSGMALQVDVIPATGSDYFTTNIEDGIALADQSLRDAFATRFPEAWARIQARRTFMSDVLGIALHPDVLPFSNIPAYLPPFLLRPNHAMTLKG